MRHEKPSYRVWRAMKRLTRDKWMHPRKVKEIGMDLCELASPAPDTVERFAIPYCCHFVGMINGVPPFIPGDPSYSAFLKWVKGGNYRIPAELVMLNLVIKEKK